ncbi:MAG TPA: rhamnogalacturonan acetylesterase [Tepidisphaeraceae bacterium]|nr:rhamnogalacturonan acetylesterase [Tepidisphaeraceae bacterium]
MTRVFLPVLILLMSLAPFAHADSAETPTAHPTLFLVGDSTVRNGSGKGANGQWGWGDRIAPFFDASKITVKNRAIGGRSSRSYQSEGRWDAVLKEAKPGDFVIIQMGHNDGGPLAGDNRERGSIRGIGEETREVTLTLKPKAGQKEVVHTYGWYMRKYVSDARAKGLIPIICSPIPHRPKMPVEAGMNEKSSYATWSAEVAKQEKVPFIDLNHLVYAHYIGVAPAELKTKYFTPADDTHTNAAGADLNAKCVVEGIRMLKDCPLKDYLLKQPAESDRK